MSQIWRGFTRWEPTHVAAAALGLAFLLMVAAFGFAAVESPPPVDGVVAAVAAVVLEGVGLLYAFRLGAGGLAD